MQQDTETDRAHWWLSLAALVFVAAAAVMGWAASFVGLHAYALGQMTGFDYWTGWLVPATFDGAAFACTLMTYRSSIRGRSVLTGRVLMWGFTAVSSWINWIHQPSTEAKVVAAGLPVAAVAVFDVVLTELRADYEACHGRKSFRLRPGLLLLRWLVDRPGTASAFRAQITNIPVHQLAALGAHTADDSDRTAETPRTGPTLVPESDSTPTAEPDSTPTSTPKPTESECAARVKRGPKLPQQVIDKLTAAQARAATEGRNLTVADVQALVKVPDAMAEDIVAAYATTATP